MSEMLIHSNSQLSSDSLPDLCDTEQQPTDVAENGSLPPLDCYWNPGPETKRERLKLRLLHGVSQAGGLLRRVFGSLAKSSVGILTYHRIAPKYAGVPFPTINVTPDRFRRQIVGLQRQGFRFVALGSVLSAQRAGATLRDKTVVLTFDDIYDNVFQNAFPILQELKIPATVFISTAFIDSKEPFLFDPWAIENQQQLPTEAWLPITDEHLRAMLASGLIELGAHTHTHRDFRNRPVEFAADLERGVHELSSRYDAKRMSFAFPYGSPRMGFCDGDMMGAVASLGLRCGLTTGPHTNPTATSPFGWGRFHVFQHDTPNSLAAKLEGWYEWLPKLKNKLSRQSVREAS